MVLGWNFYDKEEEKQRILSAAYDFLSTQANKRIIKDKTLKQWK